MKNSFSMFKLSLVVILSFSMSMSFVYCMENSNEIYINQKSKSLVSPRGESYAWFLEGEIISHNRGIEVKQSGIYTVKISNGQNHTVEKLIKIIVDASGIRKIHIIGDSTVMTYGSDKYPQTGWGQVLQLFFDETKIQVSNHAIGGRSSRSFYQEGRWTDVKNALDSNDYVFIQFGHNDRDWTKEERYTDTTDYKEYLRIYVNDSRTKGAIPVLVSPMIMNAYNGTTLRNVFTENANNYRGAMHNVSKELDVLFIDLNMMSFARINELGKEYATRFLFFGLAPNEYPNLPDGMNDGTHFQEMGALEMCKLITEGIVDWEENESKTTLVDALNPTYKVTVNYQNSASGIATVSGSYPENTHFTLKTIMGEENTFERWLDGNGNLLTADNLYQFTMEAKEYTFEPVVTDCFGTEGGMASSDNCGICSGGLTGIDACGPVFQSEKACEYDGKFGSVNDGNVTRKVVKTANFTNPKIVHGFTTETAGTYDFNIIYSGTDTTETLDIFVNDERVVESLKLQNDGNWNPTFFSVDFVLGANSLKLVSSASVGSTMFDMLAAYSDDLVASCTVEAISKEELPADAVYPNPFSESIRIDLGSPFKFDVLDLTGKILLTGNCDSSCLLGDDLENGIYVLRIIQNNNSFTSLIEKM